MQGTMCSRRQQARLSEIFGLGDSYRRLSTNIPVLFFSLFIDDDDDDDDDDVERMDR